MQLRLKDILAKTTLRALVFYNKMVNTEFMQLPVRPTRKLQHKNPVPDRAHGFVADKLI
jgi:hypothetical protein